MPGMGGCGMWGLEWSQREQAGEQVKRGLQDTGRSVASILDQRQSHRMVLSREGGWRGEVGHDF